jgi:hypothetical protein
MLLPPVRRDLPPLWNHLAVLAFVSGVTVGGAVCSFGLLVLSGLVRWAPASLRLAAFLAAAALLLAVERGWVRLRLPDNHRLIPPSRFEHSAPVAGLLFGAELGLGFRTRIPTVAPYVLAALVLFQIDSAGQVLALSAGWGLGRGLPLFLRLRATEGEGEAPAMTLLEPYDLRLTRLSGAFTLAVVPVAVIAGIILSAD